MKVTAETLENSQVSLNIEVEGSELGEALDNAYRRLVNRVSVPGFRKGKAPRVILERHIGKSALMEEALEELIPRLYREAVESQKIEPIEQPQMEIVQTEPVIFKAVVPVKPTVKLGDYHSVRLEPEKVEITDVEIDAAIELKRQEQAVFSPRKRAVRFGDLVTMDIEARVGEKSLLDHKDMVYEVTRDSALPFPGFARNLKGAKKDQEKVFSLEIPADYPRGELAGKECQFKVKVTEIKEKQLPRLDDEFAQAAGYDNLASMREKVAVELKARALEAAQQKLREGAVDAVVEGSEVRYPPVLEEREIDRLLESEGRRLGFTRLEDYLRATNRSEEKLREMLRPIVKKQIARSLVLGELARTEKIEISDSEVDNQIKEMIKGEKDAGKMGEFLQSPQVKESIQRTLRRERTVDWLVKVATGEGQGEAKEKQ